MTFSNRIFWMLLLSTLFMGRTGVAVASEDKPTFKLVTLDETVALPKPGRFNAVTLVFRIKNEGKLLTFCFVDTWDLDVRGPNGEQLYNSGFRDSVRPLRKEDFPSIQNGMTTNFVIELYVHNIGGDCYLSTSDNFGGIMRFEPVIAGTYNISLAYNQKKEVSNSLVQNWFTKNFTGPLDSLWEGSTTTNVVNVTFVENKGE